MPEPALRPEGHRTLLRLGAIAAAGALLAVALVLPGGAGAGRARPSLYGEVLPGDAEAAEVALLHAERQLAGWFNLELPDGATRPVTPAALGIRLDGARLRRMVRDVARTSSDDVVPLVVPLLVDRERALRALLELKEQLDRAALDARLDLDSRAVTPERAGRRLDVDRSLLAIEDALGRGARSAPLVFDPETPERSARELAGVRHDVLLGCFEAPFGASARERDHRFNLALAASKLDGHVLMPGGLFDFNRTVGPRDEAAGYRVAALAAAGELVDGSGSSTSLLSGTVHAAALFAGLEVIERHPPARPGAIELGLDAAVAYPVTNLRLKNPHPFPVVLRATLVDGRARVEVRGARRPHTVSVLIQIDRTSPFDVIENEDNALQRGVRVVAQRGVPGIDLHRYRIRRDGAHAVREVVREHYPAVPEITVVGASDASRMTSSDIVSARASLDANTAGRPPRAAATAELDVRELVVFDQRDDASAQPVRRRLGPRLAVPDRSNYIGAPAWQSGAPTP